MADARSETTIDDERVRVTTWSFEKAGDSTGAHVHEYDYVLVPDHRGDADGRVDN